MVCLGFLSANCKDNQAETSPSPSLSPTLAARCSLFGKKFVQLRAIYIVIVWIRMKPMFCVLPFFFFFPACISALGDKSTVHALLSIVHTLFSTVHELKNIKNESHDIIHTFKNYFTIVFSVFSFSNNKFNSNTPIRSGFKSLQTYRSGYFGAAIKLQPGYTTGVITSLYVSITLNYIIYISLA